MTTLPTYSPNDAEKQLDSARFHVESCEARLADVEALASRYRRELAEAREAFRLAETAAIRSRL